MVHTHGRYVLSPQKMGCGQGWAWTTQIGLTCQIWAQTRPISAQAALRVRKTFRGAKAAQILSIWIILCDVPAWMSHLSSISLPQRDTTLNPTGKVFLGGVWCNNISSIAPTWTTRLGVTKNIDIVPIGSASSMVHMGLGIDQHHAS